VSDWTAKTSPVELYCRWPALWCLHSNFHGGRSLDRLTFMALWVWPQASYAGRRLCYRLSDVPAGLTARMAGHWTHTTHRLTVCVTCQTLLCLPFYVRLSSRLVAVNLSHKRSWPGGGAYWVGGGGGRGSAESAKKMKRV